MSSLPPDDPVPRLRPVSEINPRPVEWLWPARLGLGKLAILEGDPGLGKSFVALDLCARLSTGQPWPDGATAGAPAASLYLNGEDSDEDTIGPRLAALGADRARVFVPDRQDGDLAAALSLPARAGALEALVGQARARLLVLDPVTAFLDRDVSAAGAPAVRRALAPLAALARRQGCAVLLVRHLTKSGRGRAIHRGLGGIGLVGTCRSAWLVAEDADVPGRRVLAQVKNNSAAPQPSLAFEMVGAENDSAVLSWLGAVDVTADALLAPPRRRGCEPGRRDAACEFLKRVLADGPLAAREVWRRAEREGFAVSTIRRAMPGARVSIAWASVNKLAISYWLLPGQQVPADGGLQAESDEIDERLRQLEELYPSRSPLDDL